jgi:hypothetical protein
MSFSSQARFQSQTGYRQRKDGGMKQSMSDEQKDYSPFSDDKAIDMSVINEAQLMLACSSWLMRKHKFEWKEK